MVRKEGPPGLRRWARVAHHVSGHGRLGNVDAELEKLTVDTRRSPERVLPAHPAYQVSNLSAGPWPSPPSRSGFPSPEQPKASSVPANDSLRLDDDDGIQATGPQPIQQNPEEAVGAGQSGARCLPPFEYDQLMAEREHFKLEPSPSPDLSDDCRNQKREDFLHAPTLNAHAPNRYDSRGGWVFR